MRAASIITALLLTTLIATSSFAHRVNVFAWIEGNTVHTESTFSSGKKAQQSKLTASDKKTGKEIASGTTNKLGEWSFSLPSDIAARKTPIVITLDAGQGHASSWTLEAEDYSSASSVAEESVITPHQPAQQTAATHSPETFTVTKEELSQIVRTAVTQELAPLKGQIAKLNAELRQPKTTFKDIFGGIGYILGLLGLAAYMRYRKQN